MEWIKTEDREPIAGDYILAKLRGCKLFDYITMRVREGEGLGHIECWLPLNDEKGDEVESEEKIVNGMD